MTITNLIYLVEEIYIKILSPILNGWVSLEQWVHLMAATLHNETHCRD